MNSRRKFIQYAGLVAGSAAFSNSFAASAFPPEFSTLLKPKRLKEGDTIAVTSPAGAVWEEKQIDKFIFILNAIGFKVVQGATLKQKYGYFAGTDEFRAAELNTFFADKNIKGIFSMKGGWGCARLLDKLNYDLIKANPKVLMGFSDITTLLNVIYAKTGLVTFHGPVGNSGWNEFTIAAFKSVIMDAGQAELPLSTKPEDTFSVINPGKASGELIGGNLSVLSGLLGSSYLPDFKNKILFLEEVKEEPYRIDKMFTQLKLNGALDKLSGLVLGKFSKCEAEEPWKAFTFMEVLEQHIKPLGIPAFYGAAFGHTENKVTLPVGIKVSMDADKGMIKLTESAVL
jgi:muramoyltetrapeptide carboxypeptidase